MKSLQLFVVCALPLLASCESTNMAQHRAPAGNQEAKRLAAAQQETQLPADVDESRRNLWNAQHDILTRDGNPNIRYY